MNTITGCRNRPQILAQSSSVMKVSVLSFLLPLAAWAGGVVTNCAEADLRAAMAGGGTVTFACYGTITLTDTIAITTNTVLDATGYQITISGGDTVRVFYVQSNVTFSVNNLTIGHGRSTNGAGVLNDEGGFFNATGTTFEANAAVGAVVPGSEGGPAAGGAVANSGTIKLVNCSFIGNSASGGAGSPGALFEAGSGGGSGSGGAVWNSHVLRATGCTFAYNSAAGGNGGDGGNSNDFIQPGGPGGPGGDGAGGALFTFGFSNIRNCTFALNTGTGGAGGTGGLGHGGLRSANGSGGLGFGGIYDGNIPGMCMLGNCTIAFNSCTGASRSPGYLSCGGIWTSGGSMYNTLLVQNVPGGNCLGVMADAGHNLSSDTTCAFTNIGSMNNTYALLGPLTNNGGLTLTMALLPGSRAIDMGGTAVLSTDQRGVPRPFGVASDIGAYEYDWPTNPGPSTVVTECTEAVLRAAMSDGGRVTFACDGTITVSGTIAITTNTLLDPADHQITISGGAAVRVFSVETNVAFSLASVTIANGNAPSGAAILNAGGFVTATNCVFSGNYATNSEVLARGGAIRNESGEVYLTACVFTNNHSLGAQGASGLSGGSGWGGALDNSGTLTADLCSFLANSAVGAGGLWSGIGGSPPPGGSGGDGKGGAICNSGTMTILRSTFTNNSAIGGEGGWGGWSSWGRAGGYGGAGEGGGICSTGTSRVVNCTFAFNTGSGGNGGNGGASPNGFGDEGGGGGSGGAGVGAVFNSGDAKFINCTFALNSGSGGRGGNGGTGGAGFYGSDGGDGGSGGSGFGAIHDLSSCWMTNCTLGSNSGSSGVGGYGGAGGWGQVRSGNGGLSGGPGSGGGGIRTTGGQLANTLLAANTPGGNGSGVITDLGHNLSSDNSCAFTNTGSMNNTPPLFGPLADNGGPTLTMALLQGSPAIDAGDTAPAPLIDQRGFPRPAGSAADIGAYEYGSMLPVLSIACSGPGLVDLLVLGNSNQWCRVLASSNLSSWVCIATNQIGADGTIHFSCDGSANCSFYRVVMP